MLWKYKENKMNELLNNKKKILQKMWCEGECSAPATIWALGQEDYWRLADDL